MLRITPALFTIYKNKARQAMKSNLFQLAQNSAEGGFMNKSGCVKNIQTDESDGEGGETGVTGERDERGERGDQSIIGCGVTATPIKVDECREDSVVNIECDLSRTFPTLAFFNKGGPLREACKEVLEAWTFYRPDIGYVQGMSFLASMLLMYLPTYQSFACLCNLLNSPSLLGLYKLEPSLIQRRYDVFGSLLQHTSPSLHSLLDSIGLPPEMFLLEWFLTIYTKPLTLELAACVWDVYLLDGEITLYVAAVALLRLIQTELLDADFEKARLLIGQLKTKITSETILLREMNLVSSLVPPTLHHQIKLIESIEFNTHS
eukprot:GHVN01102407.1.p1 GENE.GHVN01102407.1~~GHVN01102407.1.p1  ORF type:complete len:342 (+),score=58.15 GHVN01102407.1:70-1026(+)